MKQHLNHCAITLALSMTAGWTSLARAAHAAEAADAHGAAAAEHEADGGRNVLSLKLAGLEIVVPSVEASGPIAGEQVEGGRVLRRVGVSLGVERVLVPGWLDVEVSVLLAPGTGGLTLPIDLVLKKPFELSSSVEGFIGLGVATEWLEAGEAEAAYGAASQLGIYYWLDRHFAIAVEGEYNLLLDPETEHEVVLASGGAFRF